MTDSFGKVTAIFLAAILMFYIPLLFYFQRQESIHQIYILTETVYLTDSVRNTGRLTKSMYEEFIKKLQATDNLYEIKLERTRFSYRNPDGSYIEQEDHFYTEELLKEIYEKDEYLFKQGDFLRISVIKKKEGIGDKLFHILTGRSVLEQQMVAYYGGTIKYEVD